MQSDMADMADMADAARKRKRSAGGCAHEANDAVVEELKKIRARLRESSHLASNYNRAIASVQAHPEPLRDGHQAKQLRHVGNYMANQIQAILNKQRAGAATGSAGGEAASATGGDSSASVSGGARQKQRRVDPLPPIETTSEKESRPRPYAPARAKRMCCECSPLSAQALTEACAWRQSRGSCCSCCSVSERGTTIAPWRSTSCWRRSRALG
jgi:anion-transporting  ArsA/GET3 family ATPase